MIKGAETTVNFIPIRSNDRYFFMDRKKGEDHNVLDNVEYPNYLFNTAEKNTRVEPFHARKMAAIYKIQIKKMMYLYGKRCRTWTRIYSFKKVKQTLYSNRILYG